MTACSKIAGSAALVVLLWTSAAAAQPTPADAALAEAIFEQARTLMKEGRFAEACPKLADSQRLDPATGTLLNLAVCHENLGLTATAWSEFHDALTQAKREDRADRARFARQHIEAIEPALSHLTVVRPQGAGVEVRLDGALLGEAALGVAAPVDPGRHTVEATAPGKQGFRKYADFGRTGEQRTVEIPELRDELAPPPVRGRPDRRVAGILVGGAGVASLTVGALAGIQATSKWSARQSSCPGDACNPAGLDADTTARHLAVVSDVALGAGIVGVAVGTVLVLTSRAGRAGVEIRPEAGPGSAGLGVGGRFW